MGYYALAAGLNIDREDAEYIFDPASYNQGEEDRMGNIFPEAVAAHIDEVIKAYEEPK